MIEEKELGDYYNPLKSVYEKALQDVIWHLQRALVDPSHEEVAKIYSSSSVDPRVKPFESLLRKCTRDKISDVNEIPSKIEDLLGIRIATVNKDQARTLYEFLQSQKAEWFCKLAPSSEPKFVPYTIQDHNNYSLKTGYQAYHITFTYDHDYTRSTHNIRWPVEIQIMSQLWEFWTEYSRKYFYGGSSTSNQLLPYNLAISKILDTADDLMLATSQILLQAPSEEKERTVPTAGVTPSEVGVWFDKNVSKYFGRARTPIEIFLFKTAEDLNLYGISLDKLEKILQDKEIQRKYSEVIEDNGVMFLPPYQTILFYVLVSLGWDMNRVLNRVNSELALLGIQLRRLKI